MTIGIVARKLDKDVPLVCQAKGTSSEGAAHAPKSNCIIQLVRQESVNYQIEPSLLNSIERLQEQLVELVQEQGFSSDAVVKLSQRLDKYILMAQIMLKV